MPNPIQSILAGRGPVPFRDFMELALYHPEHGYYGSGRAALGRKGDYFTNVSVGAVFGRLIAFQFREMWEWLERPAVFTIVEQGANDGTFATDVLEWCRVEAPDFFEALRYEIVEGLEILRCRQRERLRGFAGKVGWSISLDELRRFTGVHFSNELIDAFPVHLVRFKDGDWRELYVTPELTWLDQPIANAALIEQLADVPRIEGYTTEVSLDAPRWAAALAAKIERGWVLAIDYGYPRERYYSAERTQGTLVCYSGHTRSPDPLADPGSSDITAHVEFTSLVHAFRAAGMQMAGQTDQHHFLTGLVSCVFANRAPSPPSPQEARGLKTLLHPEMLGTTFQVLGLSRGTPPGTLAGFRFADRRDESRGFP
ncbi:MAG: SAM-dependent methyltransferase [Chthoniobacteraceae bacterium]|jgi:SAM-dependent MidA family methyltransferase